MPTGISTSALRYGTASADHTYRMQTFWQWLRLLKENFCRLNHAQYDAIFNDELERVIARTHDPNHRDALNRMRGSRWMSYIAVALTRAGFHDER